MKLTTNIDNIDALKISIAANEAKNPIEIDLANSEGLLPILMDEKSNLKLFVSNAACYYLHEKAGYLKEDSISSVEDLLQWEMKTLKPLLNTYYISKKNGEDVKSALKTKIVPMLNSKSDKQLIHYSQHPNVVSIGDIVIWCDLYPLNLENPELINGIPKVTEWMKHLSSRQSFQNGLQSVIKSKGNRVKWNFSSWFKKSHAGAEVTMPISANITGKINKKSSAAIPVQDISTTSETNKEIPISEEELSEALQGWESALIQPQVEKLGGKKVLPVKGERNILITSALPYVNNIPHLGNIVGCVLSADIFARFCRLRGYNTLYICGTDEFGTATETKAIAEGLTNQQICDKYSALHAEIYKWFDISFDHFGRTTTEWQTKIAQDIFWDLHKAGSLLEDTMDQLYCEKCDRCLADRFVEGECHHDGCLYKDARGDQCDGCGKLINAPELKNPKCKLCNGTPEIQKAKHIFLDLPKIEAEWTKWFNISSQEWTKNARAIAQSWLDKGLQPRCITRDLKWGTPVPLDGYESKVFYVWFDAPIGYISITANYTEEWEKWWKNPDDVDYYEFMAKDNVPFHSVVFPSTLIGTNKKWSLVNHLISTEYLNYEDDKFSKSRGVGVFGNHAKDTGIPVDIWRFYLMYTRPENADTSFKWEDLMLKTNSELLANLGNFVNRALKFCKDNFDGVLGKIQLTNEDKQVLAQINRCLKQYIELLEKCREREAISQILNISRIGNQLMQAEKPWKLVKSPDDKDKFRAKSVVSLCVNISCLLAVLMEPYMPNFSKTLFDQMNAKLEDVNILKQPENPRLIRYCLKEGHKIGQPAPLIKEIKPDEIKALKEKFAGKPEEKVPKKGKKKK